MRLTDLRNLREDEEKLSQAPIRASIAPGARRAFGYKGHAAPIAADDPRVVNDRGVRVSMPTGDAKERLDAARKCSSAAQYATMMNPIPVERGDQDWVREKHQQEHQRLVDEYNLWKRAGLI